MCMCVVLVLLAFLFLLVGFFLSCFVFFGGASVCLLMSRMG